MSISFSVSLNKVPIFNISLNKNDKIKDIKDALAKELSKLNIKKYTIKFYINPVTEVPVFDSDKYDNLTLESVWGDVNKGLFLVNELKATTTQCIKVKELRKNGYNSLEEWMNDLNNLYVGRRGRIFIHEDGEKRIFHYKDSKWRNPYKVSKKDYTLTESLQLYKQHLIDSGLINELEELKGKKLGCFCDQENDCHAKVLKDLIEKK